MNFGGVAERGVCDLKRLLCWVRRENTRDEEIGFRVMVGERKCWDVVAVRIETMDDDGAVVVPVVGSYAESKRLEGSWIRL